MDSLIFFIPLINNNQIDTTEINKELISKINSYNLINWSLLISNCENIKFIDTFLPRFFRIFAKEKILIVGKPIFFNNNFAIIKLRRISASYSKLDIEDKIYFLNNEKRSWKIIDFYYATYSFF